MSNIARDGAPKRTQTSFEIKDTMKDMTDFGAGPSSPGSGPDASSPNPMEAEPLVKDIPDIDGTPFDSQVTGDGDDFDLGIGDDVMDEAVLG